MLVVGGGDVGTSRVERLLRVKADITLVCPDATPELEKLERDKKLTWIRRRMDIETDLQSQHWAMVLTAIDDRETSIEAAKRARELRIPVNAADIPEFCDFYFGSTIERGPLQVMVSTGGAAPRLARRIRMALENFIDELEVEGAITRVSKLRSQLRQKLSGQDRDTTKRRMALMSDVCDENSFAELAAFSDENIEEMIENMLLESDSPEPTPETTEHVTSPPDPEGPQPWHSLVREAIQCGNGPEPEVPPYPFKQAPRKS